MRSILIVHRIPSIISYFDEIQLSRSTNSRSSAHEKITSERCHGSVVDVVVVFGVDEMRAGEGSFFGGV